MSRGFNKYFSGGSMADVSGPQVFLMDMVAGEDYSGCGSTPELIFVCGGSINAAYADCNDCEIGEGYFLLALPGDFVSLTATAAAKLLVCIIRSDSQLYDGLQLASLSYFRDEVTRPVHWLVVNEGLKTFLDGFLPFIKRGFSSQLYFDGKIMELLFVLRECYGKTDLASLFYPLLGSEIAFKNFVFSTVGKVNTVKEMAHIANMSMTGFRAKFQKVMGESPSDMINRYKADMIKRELLFTDVPLKEISERYGFNSIHVFTRFCNRHLGDSPGNLRKSSRPRCNK